MSGTNIPWICDICKLNNTDNECRNLLCYGFRTQSTNDSNDDTSTSSTSTSTIKSIETKSDEIPTETEGISTKSKPDSFRLYLLEDTQSIIRENKYGTATAQVHVAPLSEQYHILSIPCLIEPELIGFQANTVREFKYAIKAKKGDAVNEKTAIYTLCYLSYNHVIPRNHSIKPLQNAKESKLDKCINGQFDDNLFLPYWCWRLLSCYKMVNQFKTGFVKTYEIYIDVENQLLISIHDEFHGSTKQMMNACNNNKAPRDYGKLWEAERWIWGRMLISGFLLHHRIKNELNQQCVGYLRPDIMSHVFNVDNGMIMILPSYTMKIRPKQEDNMNNTVQCQQFAYLPIECWCNEYGAAKADSWSIGMILCSIVYGQDLEALFRTNLANNDIYSDLNDELMKKFQNLVQTMRESQKIVDRGMYNNRRQKMVEHHLNKNINHRKTAKQILSDKKINFHFAPSLLNGDRKIFIKLMQQTVNDEFDDRKRDDFKNSIYDTNKSDIDLEQKQQKHIQSDDDDDDDDDGFNVDWNKMLKEPQKPQHNTLINNVSKSVTTKRKRKRRRGCIEDDDGMSEKEENEEDNDRNGGNKGIEQQKKRRKLNSNYKST